MLFSQVATTSIYRGATSSEEGGSSESHADKVGRRGGIASEEREKKN